MSRPKTAQELIHWLEEGAGARGIALAAMLAVTVALSLRIAWVQFHGPTAESTLLQADVGRQLARGAGFTTLVNYPQTAAFLAHRGVRFDAAKPYPELGQAPLYSLVIAAALRALPAGMRDALFAAAPVPPDGFRADYFLLGLNLALFWLAAWLTYVLARRLFDARTGWLAAGALLVSVGAWQQTVAVNGTPLLMVLALVVFWMLARLEEGEGAPSRFATAWLAALGAVCGLLFLAEYSAGALVLVVMAHVAWRGETRARWTALALVAAGFVLVTAPWIARNVALTGHPVALAAQNLALKAGDATAEPANQRAMLSAKLPSADLNKLGNKALTYLQENLKSRLWSGGGLWLTAFFVAGWLYVFRSAAANRLMQELRIGDFFARGLAGRAGGFQLGGERTARGLLAGSAGDYFWRRLFLRAPRQQRHPRLVAARLRHGAGPRAGAAARARCAGAAAAAFQLSAVFSRPVHRHAPGTGTARPERPLWSDGGRAGGRGVVWPAAGLGAARDA